MGPWGLPFCAGMGVGAGGEGVRGRAASPACFSPSSWAEWKGLSMALTNASKHQRLLQLGGYVRPAIRLLWV